MKIVILGGVTEKTGQSLLNEIAVRYIPEARVVNVPVVATYGGVGGPEAYALNQNRLRGALLDVLRREGPAVVWGYSAGADAAGDIAAEVAMGRHPDVQIIAVGLFADPARHRQQIVGPNRGGAGITGERFIGGKLFPVWTYSAPGDPISELPIGSPLRSLADFTKYMSADFGVWLRELGRSLRGQQFQRWWDPVNVAGWFGAAGWLNNYLTGGRHSCYRWERMQGSSLTYGEDLAKRTRSLGV